MEKRALYKKTSEAQTSYIIIYIVNALHVDVIVQFKTSISLTHHCLCLLLLLKVCEYVSMHVVTALSYVKETMLFDGNIKSKTAILFLSSCFNLRGKQWFVTSTVLSAYTGLNWIITDISQDKSQIHHRYITDRR